MLYQNRNTEDKINGCAYQFLVIEHKPNFRYGCTFRIVDPSFVLENLNKPCKGTMPNIVVEPGIFGFGFSGIKHCGITALI